MNPLVLLSLIWLPYFDGQGEFSHDTGLHDGLRGHIALELEFGIFETRTWRMNGFTSAESVVRDNTRRETFFRISPEQIHYPVGLRARWVLDSKSEWGLVVFHQSNHDIDTNDVALNRETISFEVYGVEWARRDILVQLGLYYDRGTRLDGTLQNWPFNYYLAGTTMAGEWPLGNRWFGGGQITVIAHRNKSTPIPHTTIGGHVEGGLRLTGDTGMLRVFLRCTRLTDYPFLGAPPQHMISLGVGVRSMTLAQGRMRLRTGSAQTLNTR